MRVLWFCLGLLWAALSPAQNGGDPTPLALRDWRAFVLQGTEARNCPLTLNQPAHQLTARYCVWMYPFEFELDASGGRFSGRVQSYAAGRVPLPGSPSDPPLEVRVDGQAVPVLLNPAPSIELGVGDFRIEGRFRWTRRPERLALPETLALLRLRLEGREIAPLERNPDGLWLGRARVAEPVSDALRVEVFRLLADGVPQRLTTQLVLQVSGRAREEVLGPALLPGLVPVALAGSLPARLEADGRLKVQVQPGRHVLTLEARSAADLLVWNRNEAAEPWPAQELWSYAALPSLRITEAGGDAPIDPQQAGVPQMWASHPAYVLTAGQSVSLTVQSRGRADDANRLSLQRRLWLDFDGSGYTARDQLSGTMQSAWRLNLAAPFTLGSAAVGGEAVLVTRDAAGAAGVELRQPDVNLTAMSRLPKQGELPVAGWSETLERADLTLELPPGWRLLAAPGADRAHSTWIASWSLWNVFVVALTALIAYRAGGTGFGLIVLGFLVLSHGLPGAPRWLVLATVGLIVGVRTLPAGRVATLLRYTLGGVLLLLVLAALPYADRSVRTALHPQLEQTRIRYGANQLADAAYAYRSAPVMRQVVAEPEPAPPPPQPAPAAPPAPPPESSPMFDEQSNRMEEVEVIGTRIQSSNLNTASPIAQIKGGNPAQQKYATGTVVQAGLPEPSWQWRTHELGFDGPLKADQQFRLVLLPPWLTRLWQLAAVLLLGALIWRAVQGLRAGASPGPVATSTPSATSATVALIGLVGLLGGVISPPAAAQSTPATELLNQWRQQLLAGPRCDPRCSRIAEARVRLDGDQLEIQLEVHAEAFSALPLPSDAASISGLTLRLGDRPLAAQQIYGGLWAAVPRGVQLLRMNGTLVGDQLTLVFPEIPGRIQAEAPGFEIGGIKDQRLQSGTLNLTRQLAPNGTEAVGSARAQQFPPFVEIHRALTLGLEWEVSTRVRRVAPEEGGFSVRVPLLPGERISDSSIEAESTPTGPVAVLSFAPGVQSVAYTSTLERAARLQLSAPTLEQRAEVWTFEVGETWHAEFSGVPQRAQDGAGSANPVFDPLPGEVLEVAIHRPEALPGGSVAIDSVEQTLEIGPRSRSVSLSFALRATQGGQHPLRLPEGAEVLSVDVDGETRNLRPREGVLTLPVRPGTQQVRIDWREDVALGFGLHTAPVNLGAEASNLAVALRLPESRWVLGVSGPALGPAVLYWPKLLLLLLIAMGLARSRHTPLSVGAWLLLATAFSTVFWPGLVLVAAWFLALDARRRWNGAVAPWVYNTAQLGLLALTVAVLLAFAAAVPASLIGTPDMQIAGNGSGAGQLNWFADRSSGSVPPVTVWSLPVLAWRLAMLAFALWLAFSLIGWLRWAWTCAGAGGRWRSLPKPARVAAAANATAPATEAPPADTVEPPPLPAADARAD
ncbi:MAG: hypothetical protein MUE46_04750 [Xanthomonadales bacterium]|nr:hypothetical protein [Xanthomonadales bacterium]